MNNVNALRARIDHCARSARALMAEKGARTWSAHEQAAFDALMDASEEAETQLARINAGERADAVEYLRQTAGLEAFLRKHPKNYSEAERHLVRNTMSTTTPSQGGYSVAPLVAVSFADSVKGYGWMRQVASEMTTVNGATMGYPSSDGTGEIGEAMAQNAAASSSDPSFGTRDLTPYKVGSKIFTVPVELLQDSAIDIVGMVLQRARARIGRFQNVQFTTGTGTNEPTGLVAAASVGKVGATGQTVTILYDDLADLVESVDEGSLGMPDAHSGAPVPATGWMLSQAGRKMVRKLKDTAGRPIWTPGYTDRSRTSDLPPALLLDYPVFINNDMPAPAANAKSIAFGNLASYLVRDVAELVLYRFDDSAYSTKGQVGFLAMARAGGNLLDLSAVKLYQHSAT